MSLPATSGVAESGGGRWGKVAGGQCNASEEAGTVRWGEEVNPKIPIYAGDIAQANLKFGYLQCFLFRIGRFYALPLIGKDCSMI
jgi:hypothetical protein